MVNASASLVLHILKNVAWKCSIQLKNEFFFNDTTQECSSKFNMTKTRFCNLFWCAESKYWKIKHQTASLVLKTTVMTSGILCLMLPRTLFRLNFVKILVTIDSVFYILLTVHLAMILGKWPTWHTIPFYVFISILYMFRVTSCSSSEGSIVPIQHLVNVTLCRWPFRVQVGKFLSL
jgi:hypothetical protein